MPVCATIGGLAAAIPGSRVLGATTTAVSGVAYDSRQVRAGDLFAALRGVDFDGHAFVDDAASRGAAALLVETPVSSPLPQIVASNSRAALAKAAATLFERPSDSIGVIGVTGTDGKTTAAHLIDHILRAVGERTGLIGTVAIRISDD